MTGHVATNAASSGIRLDGDTLKRLSRRHDRPGLVYLAQWALVLAATGIGIHHAQGTWWIYPAVFAHGVFLAVPAYALSHECGHGSAFRSRWLNETVFWITSLLYFEEPGHRRYAHARHHTYTWIEGKDAQMPFDTPLTLKGWLLEISGIAFFVYEARIFLRNALGWFGDDVREFTPASKLPKLKWGARACLAVYAALAALALLGQEWVMLYLVLPRLAGGVVMLLFTLIQHVEMQENSHNILDSTRSFRTNRLGRFLYANMNHHIEHHLYPIVPFHKLPDLSAAIADQLPEPDPGLVRTNWEVLLMVINRSLGRPTKAGTIRQAPHMITHRLPSAE